MHNETNSDTRDALLVAGGVALTIFGAGMILASPVIRRTLLGSLTPMLPSHEGSHGMLGMLIPDVERYLKLKSM